jgi:exodeoxyribonuclease VII small subunit
MVKIEKNSTFEENLKKLENIVEQLESGEIDLERSVELYEKGMILKNNCEEKLKKVEIQIKKIKIENNQIKKEDFES